MRQAVSKPSDANLVTRLWVIGIVAFVGLDRLMGLSSEISFGVRMISEFIQATARLAEERVVQILDADWSGLFGTARNADNPAPYETSYLEPGSDPLKMLRSLVIEYAEADVEIRDEQAVRLDSIEMELSYLSCLAEQAVAAWERGDQRMARSLEGRVRTFYQDHLGRWAGGYLSPAWEHAQTSYFKGFIRLSWGVIFRLGEVDLGSQHSKSYWKRLALLASKHREVECERFHYQNHC